MLCSKGRLVWWLTCLGVALVIGGAAGPALPGGGPEPGWTVDSFNSYPKITGNITIEPAKMRPAGGGLASVTFTGKCENGAPVTLKGLFTITLTPLPLEGDIEGLAGTVFDPDPDPGLLSRCGVSVTSGVVGLAIQKVEVIPFPDTGDPTQVQSYYGAATLQFADIIQTDTP